MTERPKYITHTETGLRIRIPPYLRGSLDTEGGQIQLEMIRKNSLVDGNRTERDMLPNNIKDCIYYRRVARVASRYLVDYAESLETERYCTIVNGSVAQGLVRSYPTPEPSDVDIHLVIDGKEKLSWGLLDAIQHLVQIDMDTLSYFQGVKIDVHVWDITKVTANKGELARNYLGSAAYPIANKGSLWEEIQSVGIKTQRYLSLPPSTRRKLRKSENGDT